MSERLAISARPTCGLRSDHAMLPGDLMSAESFRISAQPSPHADRSHGHGATATSLVGAGIVETACRVGESYGIARAELLRVAGIAAAELLDPDARLPSCVLWRVVQHIVDSTGDRGFGVRFAELSQLRTQGFWGYAFISCLSLRQAFQLLLRFSSLRHNAALSMWEEGEWAVLEWRSDPSTPAALEALASDAFIGSFCYHRRRWLRGATSVMQASLSYPEEPHHQALRALVAGPVTFDAPTNQVRIPRSELDLSPTGRDPHLLHLCVSQLERQLEHWTANQHSEELTARVRRLMRAQLHQGTSLEHVASALRVSVRTLRRRLDATGVSFLGLLERVRHETAIEYLTQTGDAIIRIAQRLGYGDPANFRRAFRRWTGESPAAFRERHRALSADQPTRDDAPLNQSAE